MPTPPGSCVTTEYGRVTFSQCKPTMAQRRTASSRRAVTQRSRARLCRKALDASVAFVGIHGTECMATRDMFLERPVSGDVLREHVARLLGACGRLSRHLPPLDLLNFAGKAANRPSSQTVSAFQGGSSSAAPVSGSQSDADVSVGGNSRPAEQRTCPQCREPLEYRQRSPVLSVAEPNDRRPRERLRYVSGWFCNNARCEYRELAG